MRVQDLKRFDGDGKPLVILNDLAGYKPFLDAAADVSIVQGAVNHAEALSVGTPVITFANREMAGSYDSDALSRSFDALAASGGLFHISDPRQLSAELGRIREHRPVVRPPVFIPSSEDPRQRTPFDLVLDHLTAYLRAELAPR